MNKTKLLKITKDVQNTLQKHSPRILTGFGIFGMITTTVMAVKATPKALKLIENERKSFVNIGNEKGITDDIEFSPKEIVRITWKCYIPSAITGCFAVFCLLSANSINIRRSEALAAAYTLSDSAFKTYQKKVIETIGEKKEKAVKDDIAKDKIKQNPVSNKEVIIVEKGNTLCYDTTSGRYFKSDIDKLKKAVNELNRLMVDETYISLNDLYYEFGLSNTKIGDDLGWNIDNGFIDLVFSSQLSEDGTPCLVIDYNLAPRYNYTY